MFAKQNAVFNYISTSYINFLFFFVMHREKPSLCGLIYAHIFDVAENKPSQQGEGWVRGK